MTTTQGDRQVLLDMGAMVPEVTVSRKAVSTTHTRGWRVMGALLAVALCAVGALLACLFLAQVRGHADETDDIRHTLREISDLSSVRAAIHLEGMYDAEFTTSAKWIKEAGPYHAHDLKLLHNEIVIPHRGLYFVYSQASFDVSCHVDTATYDARDNTVQLSHAVQKWSDSDDDGEGAPTYRTLLRSVRTACEKTPVGAGAEQGENWRSALYMGAVFNLKKGDRLRTVTENHLPQLEEEAGKTFFGVFAL